MRRHLGYTPAEVDAMPWWEIRMWAEMLSEEFSPEDSVSTSEDPSLDNLAHLGVPVRQVS